MCSFGDRPLSIRTSRSLTSIAPAQPPALRPPQQLPGLGAVHFQQSQALAAPQPADANEFDRTPSPFVKKEPKDARTYSAFPIADDDEDKYHPAQPVPTQVQAQATAPYDPAAPALRRSARHRSDRILSSRDGKMFEPPTVCFSSEYRNRQLVHVLKCHGPMETDKPKACGPNCQTTTKDDKTLRASWHIDCTHPVCAGAREKRHAAVFMPKKRQRTATPAPVALGPASAAAANDAAVRRSARFQEHDMMTAELNTRAANDDGHRIMLERAEGPGVRRKSKRHFGYAFMQEIQEDTQAERVFKATGGLDLDLDLETPMMKRERKNLHTDAKEKFTGMGAAFGLKRKAEDEEAEFAAHDKGFGADRDQERPWSYAPSRDGKKAIRNQEAPNFSMPATTYEAMLREENGVVIEREDTRSHRLPRNHDDIEEDEDAYRGVIDDSVCQACGDEDKRTPEECIHCHHRFHRPCVGKQDYDVDVDGTCYLYDGPWFCDGFGCNKKLEGVRVVCRHLECLHYDYCKACAMKKDATHRSEVMAEGGDPKGHYFVEVEGPLGPALKALEEEEEEGGFVCAQCIEDRRAKAQALANAKFGGKKTHTIAELQAEVRRLKKLQKERVQEIAAAEAATSSRPVPKLKLIASKRAQGGDVDVDMLETVDEATEDAEMKGV